MFTEHKLFFSDTLHIAITFASHLMLYLLAPSTILFVKKGLLDLCHTLHKEAMVLFIIFCDK